MCNTTSLLANNYGFYESANDPIRYGVFASTLRDNIKSEWKHCTTQLPNIHLVELNPNVTDVANALHSELPSLLTQLPISPPLGIAACTGDNFCLLLASQSQSSADIMRVLSEQRLNWWNEFVLDSSVLVNEDLGKLSLGLKDQTPFEEIETFKDLPLSDGSCLTTVHAFISVDCATRGILLSALSADKKTLHIHRRLAPYKLGIVTSFGREDVLFELCEHLAGIFRSNNLPCVITGDSSQLDRLGIPFTLKLTEDTIRTGVAQLRDIDVKIWGDVHLSCVLQRVQNSIGRHSHEEGSVLGKNKDI